MILRDNTGHKQAERDRGLLASIVESSEDAILSVMLDGTLASWNRGAESLLGHSGHEAIGKHFNLFVLPARRAPGKGHRDARHDPAGHSGGAI